MPATFSCTRRLSHKWIRYGAACFSTPETGYKKSPTTAEFADLHVNLQFLGARFGPKPQNDGQFRRDDWIGAVRERANGGSRAPTDVWEAFSEHVSLERGAASRASGARDGLLARTQGAAAPRTTHFFFFSILPFLFKKSPTTAKGLDF